MTSPLSVSGLPVSARLAWWGTAWLRGHVVTDLMLDAVIGDDASHLISGPGGTEALAVGLATLRRTGAQGVGLALPVEGDLLGLGGPRDFNSSVLDAGEGVVADSGLGLVPDRVGAAVTWVLHEAQRRQVPDVGEADRALRRAVLESGDALAALDVARWRPEVADELMNLRHPTPPDAPPGTPARCVELAARGLQATSIVDLALADDGAAVSAGEIEQRRTALVPLDRAGRRALVAAFSPEAWPT